MFAVEYDKELEFKVIGQEKIEEGREQGVEKEKKDTAIKMLKEGFNIDIISRIVGKPLDWIEEIAKSNRI